MMAAATSARFYVAGLGSDARPTLAVIPAKAGIHAAAFTEVGRVAVSTPKAPAEWIPAFAGMTTEGVVTDAALLSRADCDRVARPMLAVIPAEAGIHAAVFAQADGFAASTTKASAEWIPAFAGMTVSDVTNSCAR
ncbi:MAG: hypothetical protein P0Y66_15645 [Candidatus Kaistia colombiensis]|nr:MAG: hypothetical protein P0Y66_15645 [Kaistia sp.]